jgi:hypothetical protein
MVTLNQSDKEMEEIADQFGECIPIPMDLHIVSIR